MLTDDPQRENPRSATTRSDDDVADNLFKEAGRQFPMPPEEKQKGGVRKPVQAEPEAVKHAAQSQHYAELDFIDRDTSPPPPSDRVVVACAEVSQA